MNVLARGAVLAVALTAPWSAGAQTMAVDYVERVRLCSTYGYAMVESIITFRDGIFVAVEATGAQPSPADQRLMATVAKATGTGAGRMLDTFGDCLIELREGLEQSALAFRFAQEIGVEIDFAIIEINGAVAVIDEAEAVLRAKWGTAGTAQAATVLQRFRDFAFVIEGYLEEIHDFVAALVEHTDPGRAAPSRAGSAPPAITPPGAAQPPAAPRPPPL